MQEIQGKYTSAKIYANNIEPEVIEQTLDICNHSIFKDATVRIMPDCHKGKGCTIGFTSTMPKNGEIIPNIIGVDQSCGMLAIKLKECKTTRDYLKLDKVIRSYVPGGTGGKRKEIHRFLEDTQLKENIIKASKDYIKENPENELLKVGTLGAGNHFISLEKGETGLYLIIHSGSRNFGNKLAVYFQQKAIETNCYQEGYLKQLSFLTGKDAEDYLFWANVCNEYASLSRKIMAKEILDNMNWDSLDTIETVHNYIGEDKIIRKGAISCKENEKVLIPINMAYGSFIAIGKGNSDWNNSGPHGAGRVLSRTQAKETLTMNEYKKSMKGVHSSCITRGTLDEAPMAYKDGDEIKELILPTAEIIDHLKPVYNFKAS